MKKRVLLLLLFLTFFGLDFISKSYTHSHIPSMHLAPTIYPYGGIAVFHDCLGVDFSINHVMNRGAAWGNFASFQKILLYVRMSLIAGMICYLFFFARPARQLPITLILAGAIGNVVDYFMYGHVVDMFYFVFWGHSYPLFNIADSAIFCGIAILLFQSLREKKRRLHA